MKGDAMMSIATKRQSRAQVADYDFWSVFLSLAALFFFFLSLLLVKVPTHADWLDMFASRGLRVCSVSAFVTAIVGLFRFRYSRALAIIALLVSVPLVWLFVVVPLFTGLSQ